MQNQRDALADQVADRPLVIVIFHHLLAIDAEGALLAVRTTWLAAGKELMAIDTPRRTSPQGCWMPVAFELVGKIAKKPT